MKHRSATALLILLMSANALGADETPSDEPKPVPTTRPEMKAALEALKDRKPRLPLPVSQDQGGVNNGRMRAQYLPESWGGGGFRGDRSAGRQGTEGRRGRFGRFGQDPNSTMDYAFTTSLFWVVSRGNNCHYCLGHQELKLRGAGLEDDTIASLDCDWSGFEPRQQAALAFARKLTLEPQLIADADIMTLKKHFTDAEIIELAFNVSRFNATNRWTDGMGIPQDRRFGEEENSLVTPTSERFLSTVSVAVPATRASRPSLPTADEVMQALDGCRERTTRVALPSNEDAQRALTTLDDREPLAWERAMAQLAGNGPAQVTTINTIMTDEHLPVRLKAELALISAIHNRAWYAAGHAIRRLRDAGASHEDLVALFDEDSQSSPSAAAYRLATKSTTDPHLITDADIARVREHYDDAETAQVMHVICMANMFDRFTESLGLPLEHGM